jgi:hypothetical protein
MMLIRSKAIGIGKLSVANAYLRVSNSSKILNRFTRMEFCRGNFVQKFLLCDTMKFSQIVAKAVVRVFFIMLLIALIPYLQGNNTKLEHIYLMPKNVWSLAFPILLILGFVVLLVICSIKKYSKQDLNWLLVINTVVLIAYAVTVYIRIYQLTK